MINKNAIAIFDVDGVFTDGTFWQNKTEKYLKRFGADDFDAVDILKQYMKVQLITGDKKGFEIVNNRMKTKNLDVQLVSGKPKERWNWIKKTFPDYSIVFIGDGIYDWYSLSKADIGITTIDALKHVQSKADYISCRTGANRFVADACLYILEHVYGVSIWTIGM